MYSSTADGNRTYYQHNSCEPVIQTPLLPSHVPGNEPEADRCIIDQKEDDDEGNDFVAIGNLHRDRCL